MLNAKEPIDWDPAIRYPESESCASMRCTVNINKDQNVNQHKTRSQKVICQDMTAVYVDYKWV